MPNIRWKSIGRVLLAALFAYMGAYLVGPGHIIKSYVQWGYPLWAHFVAGASFLTAATLLPFRHTRWLGAGIGCSVLIPAAVTCLFHGDYGHAIQSLAVIGLIGWLVCGATARAEAKAQVGIQK